MSSSAPISSTEKIIGNKNDRLADWDGPDDPENPKNFAAWRKWVIVITVSSSSLCV
jgi:hypothetical protein